MLFIVPSILSCDLRRHGELFEHDTLQSQFSQNKQ